MSIFVSGQKCHYRKCGNTRRSIIGLKLFRFPNDPAIREIWIRNSGNPDLAFMSAEVLRRRYLCQYHFDSKDIKSSGNLIKGTVPFKYKPKPNLSNEKEKVADSSAKIPPPEPFDENVLSEFLNFESATEDPIEYDDNRDNRVGDAYTRKITKLKEQVRKQSKMIKTKNSLISKLRARVRELKSLLDINKSFGIVAPKARRIAQIKGHKRKLVGQKKKTS